VRESCSFRRQSRRRNCHHRGAGDTDWLVEDLRTVAGGGSWVDVEVFAQHFSEQADSAIEKARNRDDPFEKSRNKSKRNRHQRFRAAERGDNRMRTHENMKIDVPILSPIWGGY